MEEKKQKGYQRFLNYELNTIQQEQLRQRYGPPFGKDTPKKLKPLNHHMRSVSMLSYQPKQSPKSNIPIQLGVSTSKKIQEDMILQYSKQLLLGRQPKNWQNPFELGEVSFLPLEMFDFIEENLDFSQITLPTNGDSI